VRLGRRECLSGIRGGVATILVIEDEPAILTLAESVLQREGYETLSAATLAQAQAVLHDAQNKIDLVLTDIALGDQSEGGIQVGQVARQTTPNTPVLYTSGFPLNDGMKALFVWPYKFLTKPYTDLQLIEAVASLLKRI
jgi:CheY-like chemotaxis protein